MWELFPNDLLHNFKSISDAHSHNTRGSNFNFVLSRELSHAPTGFSFLAIKQWNALPNDIKSVTELRVFKRRLNEFFLFPSMTDSIGFYRTDLYCLWPRF